MLMSSSVIPRILIIFCISSFPFFAFSAPQNKSQISSRQQSVEMSEKALSILADTLRYNPLFDSIAFVSNPLQRDLDPVVSSYLLPLTFYGKVSPSNFEVNPEPIERHPLASHVPQLAASIVHDLAIDSIRERTTTRVMAQNPDLIAYDWALMPDAPKKEILEATINEQVFRIGKPDFTHNSLNVGLPEADRWKSRIQSAIQFSQNYVTENWYKGGESNVNILSVQNFEILRYDPSKRMEFVTKIDLKTGIYTTPSDTMRQFRVNEDLFQVSSKYGLRAFERWYYTGSMLFKTQLFNSYKANSNELMTQFLSPAEFNFSVGMDYKYQNSAGNFNWSILLAPLAYNLKYVANIEKIDETRFGITEGRHTLNQVGSSLTNEFTWQISKNIVWDSRLFFFSNYHESQADLENTLNFSINRYFSTRIILHLRYDDDIKPEDDPFQFKELLSFGFNYVW